MQCFNYYLFVAKPLNLLNLTKALDCVSCNQYVDVGLALGVDYDKIKKFEVNYPNDIERVFKEILYSWLNSCSSHTWASLAQTLSDNGFSKFTNDFPL